jgi:hypothetical protein
MEHLRCRASLKSTVQAAFKTHLPIPPTHESDARAHIALPKLPIKLAVACPAKSREGQRSRTTSPTHARIALLKLPITLAVACPAKSREGLHYSSTESDARAHIALLKLPIKLAVACPAKSREGQHYSSNGIR